MKNVRITAFQFFENKTFSIVSSNISENFEQLNEKILSFLTEMCCVTLIYFLQDIKNTVQTSNLLKNLNE